MADATTGNSMIAQLSQFQTTFNNLSTATTADEKTQQLPQLTALNTRMSAAIATGTRRADVQGSLGEIGALRAEIARLKELREEAKVHADTAKARKDSVEQREQVVSYHQLFFVQRPIKEFSVPTLLIVSSIFVLLGIRWLYLLYYGVGSGPINMSFLTGFGEKLSSAGERLSGFGSTLSSAGERLSGFRRGTNYMGLAGTAAAPTTTTGLFGAFKLPGQGITAQLG